jgi:hypothetical protein
MTDGSWEAQDIKSFKEFVEQGTNTGMIALKFGTTEAVVYTKAYELGLTIPEDLYEEAV